MAENPARSKTKPARTHPTLYNMVLEALKFNKTSKGLTLQGIKKYIIETYPETKENFSNLRLRTAMKKGFECNEIIRPKSSENEGLTGHFLLNRALMSQKEQEKKAIKAKASKESKATKKLVTKSPNKITKKTPEKATLKAKKKTAVKKMSSAHDQTPKMSKAERAGAHAKTSSVKKMKKTAIKTSSKTKSKPSTK